MANRRVYSAPRNSLASIGAWLVEVGTNEIGIFPEGANGPGVSLSWFMTASNARQLAAFLVEAADAVDATKSEVA